MQQSAIYIYISATPPIHAATTVQGKCSVYKPRFSELHYILNREDTTAGSGENSDMSERSNAVTRVSSAQFEKWDADSVISRRGAVNP